MKLETVCYVPVPLQDRWEDVSNGRCIIYGARQSRKKKTTMVRTWNQMPCWVSICFHQLCTSLVSYSNRTQQCLMAKPITSKLHTLFFPIDAHYFIYYFFKWNDSKFYIEIGSAPMMLVYWDIFPTR